VSLYRQPGRGSALVIVAAAVVALAVGIAIGYALGSSGDEEVSAGSIESSLRSELSDVDNGLVLLPNEYRQAYSGSGKESVGVDGVIARMRAGVDEARTDLEALDPEGLATLDRRIEALQNAVSSRQPPARVEALAAGARRALEDVPGGS
jgi:hypothetical protein